MTHMAFNVYHNVAVMTVFDLKNVTDYGVSSKTVAEVVTSLLVAIWILSAELLKEVVIKCCIESYFFFDSVQTHRVGDRFH